MWIRRNRHDLRWIDLRRIRAVLIVPTTTELLLLKSSVGLITWFVVDNLRMHRVMLLKKFPNHGAPFIIATEMLFPRGPCSQFTFLSSQEQIPPNHVAHDEGAGCYIDTNFAGLLSLRVRDMLRQCTFKDSDDKRLNKD